MFVSVLRLGRLFSHCCAEALQKRVPIGHGQGYYMSYLTFLSLRYRIISITLVPGLPSRNCQNQIENLEVTLPQAEGEFSNSSVSSMERDCQE